MKNDGSLWLLLHTSRPPAIHKKPQSPQAHISQAIHCSPCLADPHAPRIPIRVMFPYVSADPPYGQPAPKNPAPIPPRPAFPAPQTRHPQASTNSLRRLPARYRMPGLGAKSAETSGRFSADLHSNPVPSNSLLQRLGDMDACDDAASASTSGGPMPVCASGIQKGGRALRQGGEAGLGLHHSACGHGEIAEKAQETPETRQML